MATNINYKRIRSKFGNLSRGETFIFGDHLYMVISKVYNCNTDARNAICLEDGSLMLFCNTTEVEVVDLNIEVS